MKVRWVYEPAGENEDAAWVLFLDDRRTCGGVQVMAAPGVTLYVPYWLVYVDGGLDGSVHHTSLPTLKEAKDTVLESVAQVPSRNRHRLFPPN